MAVYDPNEFENLYSQCANSSAWDNNDPKPRTCSLGLYGGTVAWQQCAKCNMFRQSYDEADAVQTLLGIKAKEGTSTGEKPSSGGCSKCSKNKDKQQSLRKNRRKFAGKRSEGLGDTIAKITKLFGFKPCSACEKRRKALNKKVPYGQRIKNLFSSRSSNN